MAKVPSRKNKRREALLAWGREVASKPGKWALDRAFGPDDDGKRQASNRARELRRPTNVLHRVGAMEVIVRFDPGFTGDYPGRTSNNVRGAWLVMLRYTKRYEMDKRYPGIYEGDYVVESDDGEA